MNVTTVCLYNDLTDAENLMHVAYAAQDDDGTIWFVSFDRNEVQEYIELAR